MCGIVGFTGTRQAAPILLDGLSKLEYRGYDSAGMAVRDGENLAQVVKAKGRLSNLMEKTDNGNALKGTCGIGHTRWATHGEPSQTNAHPHVSGNCTRSGSGAVESEVVGVHNGIIENYTELKEKLLKHGYTFYSQTDTEVVIKLVDYYYKKYNLGAYLMGLTTYGNYEIEDQVNFTVYVPKVDEHFVGSLAVIPLQLMGYYVSVAKGLDVDKPRNLAKSVTVE